MGLGEAMTGFKLTEKQTQLNELLAGEAMYILAYGGARSAKTFGFLRAVAIRALRAPGSLHLIARYRFNAAIQSIWHDTLPKVFALCYPDIKYHQDKLNWFWMLPNGAQIWFGGLDEKERTEKILGNEYSTILLNECSQISFQAYTLLQTRLAQNSAWRCRCTWTRTRRCPRIGDTSCSSKRGTPPRHTSRWRTPSSTQRST